MMKRKTSNIIKNIKEEPLIYLLNQNSNITLTLFQNDFISDLIYNLKTINTSNIYNYIQINDNNIKISKTYIDNYEELNLNIVSENTLPPREGTTTALIEVIIYLFYLKKLEPIYFGLNYSKINKDSIFEYYFFIKQLFLLNNIIFIDDILNYIYKFIIKLSFLEICNQYCIIYPVEHVYKKRDLELLLKNRIRDEPILKELTNSFFKIYYGLLLDKQNNYLLTRKKEYLKTFIITRDLAYKYRYNRNQLLIYMIQIDGKNLINFYDMSRIGLHAEIHLEKEEIKEE